MAISTRCRAELFEGKAQDRHRRLGSEPLAGHGLVHPVADEGILERAPLDRRQRDLAHEPIGHEDPESVPTSHLTLALACRAPGREAGAVLRCQWRTCGTGLPGDEPPSTSGPYLEPSLVVVLAQGPKSDPSPRELERRGPSRAADHLPSTSPSAPRSSSTLRIRAVWPMQPIRHARPAITPTPAPISIP